MDGGVRNVVSHNLDWPGEWGEEGRPRCGADGECVKMVSTLGSFW